MHILFSSGAQICFEPFSIWLFLPCIYTVYNPRHPPKQMEFGDLPHVYLHSAQSVFTHYSQTPSTVFLFLEFPLTKPPPALQLASK